MNPESLIELGKYGVVGVCLALICLVAIVVWMLWKMSTNHINHSTEVMVGVQKTLENNNRIIERNTEAILNR